MCTKQSICHYQSPLGSILLAADGIRLTGLWFVGQKYFPDALVQACPQADLPVFQLAKKWLDLYFSGVEPDLYPPMLLAGTPFQNAVWQLLRTIPYGQTVTYGQIARQLAQTQNIPRMSARAVGSAVGKNRLSILIPCHRVVGANGALTGYAGGLERKLALLQLEHAL